MIPHFLLLFGVTGLARFTENRRFSPGVVLLLRSLIVAAMALFAGMRGDHVGVDTSGYVERFLYLVSIDEIWDSASSVEPGYKALVALARLMSDDPTAVLLVTSAAASFLYFSALLRLVRIPSLALFIFIAYGFYTFHMNGLRQGLALGVYMHALPSLVNGRPVRYGLWVLTASLFHTTAIFTLPVYWLFRIGFSVWTLLLLAVMAAFTVVGLDLVFQFAGLANERYALYGQNSATGGTMLTLIYVILSSGFVLGRSLVRVSWRTEYDKFLLMMLFGTMIYIIVLLTGSYVEMTRMALYFTVSMALLWPLLLRSIPNLDLRFGITVAVLMGSCLFYYVFLNQIGGYVPYSVR